MSYKSVNLRNGMRLKLSTETIQHLKQYRDTPRGLRGKLPEAVRSIGDMFQKIFRL